MKALPNLVFGITVISSWSIAAAAEIRFNRDIRPILSENCFQCHGPDHNARQANLRLDREEEAVAAGAIKPGDPGNSKLVQRIRASDPVRLMPPSWSNKKLSDEQKDLLTRWIKQGAQYEPHWAYIKPERPEAPEGPAAIDHLVNRKLEEKALRPVSQADRRTLARRLSFDLTGLPPSPETVDAFVNDSDARAYERLVEKFMSSPQFGERMAVHWLDLVRYADTMGYHSDVPISMYPYRDYVIRAFNENKPFDQFTREQLGGDLLPNPTTWQRVASGYNRLNRMTNEGGAQPGEYLVRYLSDRLRATSTVWLGSTLGCAECHDHKFDPFTTKDFYQFAAFFADIEEVGVYVGTWEFGPRVRVPTPEGEQEIAGIDREIAKLEQKGKGQLSPGQTEMEDFARYVVREDIESWVAPKVRELAAKSKSKFRRHEDGTIEIKGEAPDTDIHRADLNLGPGKVTAIRLEALQFPTNPFPRPLLDAEKGFMLTRFTVEIVRRRSRPQPIPIVAAFDNGHEERRSALYALDDNEQSGWGRSGEVGDPLPQALFLLESPLELRPGDVLRVRMYYESKPAPSRFRLSVTDAAFPEFVPGKNVEEAVLAKGDLTADQQTALKEHFLSITNGNSNWKQILELERQRQVVFQEGGDCLTTHAVEARTVRVLPRGNWMDESGEIVEPQAPHFLKQIPIRNGRLTRLDLANWLVDRGNPLTARVFVNRLWKAFFGTGLSKILNDIGSQGEAPQNQDLLDWLAVEFMESGWDVKHILRTMLLSETYRRSSEPTEELKAGDPYNIYHGRQSATRLDAEFIRDGTLSVSGRLNPTIGGPSVKPYQPAGYYKELNFPKRTYKADLNENQFRRGLYTHWQRQYLHPSLMAFDAPSREECVADRSISNTPLQALTLLNDPTYVEAARTFAKRILKSAETDTGARLDFAFRHAFSRNAEAEEREVLAQLLKSQREHFKNHPEDAENLLSVGISEVPEDLDVSDLAAWTSVARAIFNKHEFIMRY